MLVTGRAVGEKIASGTVRVIADARGLSAFRPGEVLVAESTSPDWEPVMKTAAAIVTSRGGRTCHAAIVARELGVPAVVGAEGATERLKTGAVVTVSCAEGETGKVYGGELPFEATRVPIGTLPRPRTEIMVNLGNPELAYHTAMLPNDGVGLARMEFIISEHIGVHPMALVSPDKVASKTARAAIARLVRNYARPTDFFVEKLSEGVGTIAAAFYPKPVIVRLSDFKTNEYASLIGGAGFEPKEDNPMLGFRGASRYAHPAYAAGFALECAALARVRDEMGLTNLKIMVPFCRRVAEAEQVIAAMARHGLKRGENGLEIYVMCEIPNNVIQIDAFAQLFDGFSIGSNDLTQLTLGVDRDSEIVAFDFDERDPGMLEMLRLAVTGAKRNHRHVGICGEAPANYPEIARFLAGLGIEFDQRQRGEPVAHHDRRARSGAGGREAGARRPIGRERCRHGSDRHFDDEPGARHRHRDRSGRAGAQASLRGTALRCRRRRHQCRAGGPCAGRRGARDFPGRRCRRRDDPASVGRGRRCLPRRRDCRVHPRKPRRRRAPERQPISLYPARTRNRPRRPGALPRRSLRPRRRKRTTSSPAAACRSAFPTISMRASRTLAQPLGKRLVLDTSGAALKQAGHGIYLLKPSLRELEDLVGRDPHRARRGSGGPGGDRARPRRDRRPVARRPGALLVSRRESAFPRSRSRREAQSAPATACWQGSCSASRADCRWPRPSVSAWRQARRRCWVAAPSYAGAPMSSGSARNRLRLRPGLHRGRRRRGESPTDVASRRPAASSKIVKTT